MAEHNVIFSYDADSVTVPLPMAIKCSLLVAEMVDGDDVQEDLPIALPAGSRTSLALLKEYMTLRNSNQPKTLDRPLEKPLSELVDDVDKMFLAKLGHDEALELLSAAMFINYPALKDLMSAQLADWMTDMSLDEIRTLWGVTNDFTPEEIEALKREHSIIDR
jgi:hypothetical protein